MKPGAQIDRFERLLRVVGVAGSVVGASWGIQWMLRTEDPFGKEGVLQLVFSLVIAIPFALGAMGKGSERWRWANVAFLSVVWVWRCAHKNYPLGVVAFSISAGLAIVCFLLATWKKRLRLEP